MVSVRARATPGLRSLPLTERPFDHCFTSYHCDQRLSWFLALIKLIKLQDSDFCRSHRG